MLYVGMMVCNDSNMHSLDIAYLWAAILHTQVLH